MSIDSWQQVCPDGTFACHISHHKQCGIIRFNCADSLDRTNIATFCNFLFNFHLYYSFY